MLQRGWAVVLLSEILPFLSRSVPARAHGLIAEACFPAATALRRDLVAARARAAVILGNPFAEKAAAAELEAVGARVASMRRMTPKSNTIFCAVMLVLARPQSYALPLIFAMNLLAVIPAMMAACVMMLVVTLPLFIFGSPKPAPDSPIRRLHAYYSRFQDKAVDNLYSKFGLPMSAFEMVLMVFSLPVFEELVCRHGAQRALMSVLSIPAARCITAVLFVLGHVSNFRMKFVFNEPSRAVQRVLRQASFTFLNSVLVFSPVYEQRGAWAAAGAHGFHNALGVLEVMRPVYFFCALVFLARHPP